MTAMADITIKKADGTTNITWAAIAASGGDKSPALWRSSTASGTVGQQPSFQLSSQWNGAKTVRQLDFEIKFPSVYTDSSTSLTQVLTQMNCRGTYLVPQNVGATDLSEFAHQAGNLLAASIIASAVQAGYAPV